MTIVTYDRTPAGAATAPTAVAKRKAGFFDRLVAAMIASQHKRAAEELRRHGILLPDELNQPRWKVSERSEDSLPFVR